MQFALIFSRLQTISFYTYLPISSKAGSYQPEWNFVILVIVDFNNDIYRHVAYLSRVLEACLAWQKKEKVSHGREALIFATNSFCACRPLLPSRGWERKQN